MKISIITICLNNYSGLRRTRESVESQDIEAYEHIIVDGGSNDHTKEYLSTLNDEKTIVISGRDSGRSDAFNRGINIATGDYIICLNSGDIFSNSHILSHMMKEWLKDKVDVYSYAVQTDDGAVLRGNEEFWKGGHIMHQGLFIHRSVYDKVGLYNKYLHNRMDYDFFVRMAREDVSHRFVDTVAAIFDTGGITSFNRRNFLIEGIGIRLIYEKEIDQSEIERLNVEFNNQDNGECSRISKQLRRYEYQTSLLSKWMVNIIDGTNEIDYFVNRGIDAVAVYGMGILGRLFIKRMNGKDIVKYAIDKNADSIAADIKIVKPEFYMDDGCTIIITAANDRYRIREELRNKTNSPILFLEEVICGV